MRKIPPRMSQAAQTGTKTVSTRKSKIATSANAVRTKKAVRKPKTATRAPRSAGTTVLSRTRTTAFSTASAACVVQSLNAVTPVAPAASGQAWSVPGGRSTLPARRGRSPGSLRLAHFVPAPACALPRDGGEHVRAVVARDDERDGPGPGLDAHDRDRLAPVGAGGEEPYGSRARRLIRTVLRVDRRVVARGKRGAGRILGRAPTRRALPVQ